MAFRIDQLAVLNLATVGNSVTAGSFVKSGGTSSQFLKADGSVDSNTYITSGSFLPLSGGTLTGVLTITTSNDGALTLRVPSGDANQWNYINFNGTDNVRDAYFGTDGSGNPTWWRDDNSLNVVLGSTFNVNGAGLTLSTADADVRTNRGRFQVYNNAGSGNLGYRIRTDDNGGWRWQFVDGSNNEYFGVAYSTGVVTFGSSSGTIASRGGFSDFIGYNASYGSYIGGGVANASNYLYAGGYFYDGSTVRTLWHTGNFNPGSYLPLSGGTMTGALRFNEGGFGRIAYVDNYHGMILRGHPSDATGNVNVTDVTSLIQHSGDFRFYRTNGTVNEIYFQVNASAAYWRGNTIIHSGTIGSQSVAYASNADTVDGYHMNQNVLTTSSPTFSNVTADGSVAAYGLRFRNGAAITYCGFGGGELNNIFHTESAWGNLRHGDISNYEVSADGSSWSAGTLDANIYNLFLGERDKGGSLTIAASGVGRYQRFTFAIGYKNFDMLHITGSTNGEQIYIKLETSTDGGSTYSENFTSIWSSWPGNHTKVWSIFNSAITRIRLTIYKPGNNYGNSASINSINYYGGYSGYGERYHMQVYSYDYQSASITRNTFIGGSLTVYGNETISGSGYGLYFSGGNNRIYFAGSRAMEGNGTNLQIGEGHSQTQIQSATTQVDGNIVMAKGSDPRIYSNTNVGLNIDGQALYLNRYVSSDISMVFGGGNVMIGPYSGPSFALHVKKNQNQVAGFESPNANTWIDLISTAGTWSMGATSSNTWAIYQRGAANATRFEVGPSSASLYGNTVWHAGNLTNLNQLSNGPGYVTGGPYLPLSGGTMTGNLYIQSGGNPTQFNLRGTNPELYIDAAYGGGTARLFINRQSNANQATLLFTTGATVTNGTAWNFTGTPIWSMGMTNSSQVSDFKLAYGDIFDANSVALRIDTSRVVYFSNTPYVGGNTVWHAGNDGSGSGLDADTVDGYNVGTSTNNIPYLNGSRNLVINNPETYSGEVRLGAAWDRGGIYASSTLTMGTSSGNIDFVHSNSITARLVGNTGNYGSTLMLGTTSPTYTLIDGNYRPVVYLHGNYPVLTLNHTVPSNSNHGPTLQFVHNGDGARQWVIGTNGPGTRLDIGYSDSGYSNTNYNPHNGIAGYNGKTIIRIIPSGVLIGDCGTYPTINVPSYPLQVNGKSYFSNNMTIYPQSESWAEGLSFTMPNTSTWGGLRWRRERAGNDGNWYVGFTALDSSDDLVFGANNGGTQVDNIIRMTKAGIVSAKYGYVSYGNPWGTSDSAYFPNGITTAGGTNWVYGHTYIGNAPSNGQGAEISNVGRIYVRNGNTSGTWGYAGLFLDNNNAANNYVPWSFEEEYGNHSWGIVARFHIRQASADRPSIQFTAAGGNDRWSLGYCTGSDWNFRITQNHGYRTDNSTNDGWGTERFRINTDGATHLALGSNPTVYFARHIDARDTWGSCGCITAFLGWNGSKVMLGNGNSGGHDYGNARGGNTIISTNPHYFYTTIEANGVLRFNESDNRRMYGASLGAGYNAIRVNGNWDNFDIMGRVLDWTGSNMHFGNGYNGESHANYYMVVGNPVSYFKVEGPIYATGDVIAYYSDRRLKQNIQPINSALDIINKIGAYTFEWNKKSEEVWAKKEGDKDFGLISQEVEAVWPMGVAVQSGKDINDKYGYGDPNSEYYDPLHIEKNPDEYKTVRYDKMVTLAIAAIKEQQLIIESQQKQIDELKQQLKNK